MLTSDDGGLLARRGKRDPVLFQLPKVLAAVAEGRTVVLCEGEKDALRAEQLFPGAVGTTNPSGSSAWDELHSAPLAGVQCARTAD